jgi:STE24 endopeptidase
VSGRDVGRRRYAATALILLSMIATPRPAAAHGPQPEKEAAGAAFDPEAATAAYLASVPPEARARSDAYFEGGYWLQLWGFLWGAAVNGLLLVSGLSARMRDRAVRLVRIYPLQTGLYWAQFLLLTTVLLFPLAVYQGFVREHQYGLSTQTFGAWLWDQTKALLVGLVVGGLFVAVLYGVLRRAPRTWWLWGAGVAIAFTIVGFVVAPVFVAPLFNTYTSLQDAGVREPILRMARANGIAADTVYQMDASRQTRRISANVSGLLGTERITLNDNLLARCTLPEIEAVMGHEIGHYVLNHVYEWVVVLAVVLVGGFALLRWGVDRALVRWGARWRVTGIADPAGLPLLSLMLSTYLFLLTPLLNTIGRTLEYEADLFGLNAARQPEGFAQVALKLAEYRKLEPSRLEEWIFYDHPSGRTRIFTAMRWKAAQSSTNRNTLVGREAAMTRSVWPISSTGFPFCRYSFGAPVGAGPVVFPQTFD